MTKVGLDRVADERQQVDLPAVVVGDDPPAAECLGQGERMPAGAPGERPGGVPGIPGERDVKVGGLTTEELIAHRPADQPGRGVDDLAERFERRRAHAGSPSR